MGNTMYNPSKMSAKLFSLAVAYWSLLFVLTLPFVQGTRPITQNPDYACPGDRITVSCELTVLNDRYTFIDREISFNINGQENAIFDCQNGGACSHNGVDITRFQAHVPIGSPTNVNGMVSFIYNSSDEGLPIGCLVKMRQIGSYVSEVLNRTHRVVGAAPPSAPSLQSSVSNFNTATCSADISLSWNTPPSTRTIDRYFLYLDGSPLATTNSNSYTHSTILNINTDYQHSVSAMSCAGNSTASTANIDSVASFSLMRSSQTEYLAYDNVTGRLTVNWELSTPTQSSGVSGLDITYSLQLLYSHSRQGVTYAYTDSTNFTLPSSQLSYNTTITAHNFTQLDGVETNITANLMIVQQCGQSFSGTAMECFYNSNTSSAPTPTNITDLINYYLSPEVILIIGSVIIGAVVFLCILMQCMQN